MPHETDLILLLGGGLTAALVFGFITQKMRLSPIVGYLLAGVAVGPYSPGFAADAGIAAQCAEIGIILLMFGVGLQFHLKELLAVQRVALPGALAQIAVSTLLGMFIAHGLGWSWSGGAVFGMSISVASTVVLTRVLADHNALHTPAGHVALGWLVVEDLFTILALVLLPAAVTASEAGSSGLGAVVTVFCITILKLFALVVFTLVAGQKLIPLMLSYVARTGTRDLFTLAVLVLALGIAVGAAKFFGASMALGAFLAGMVVGQSEFSARAAADALPMRDAFAVLFFVSVGMLFEPAALVENLPLILATLAIVLLGKPLVALLVVLLLGRPIRLALSVAVALAQIGEFSFILASLGTALGLLPQGAANALIVAGIVSITLNPLLYRRIESLACFFERRGIGLVRSRTNDDFVLPEEEEGLSIVVGYGPVGRNLAKILRENHIAFVVVEMNIDTVHDLRAQGLHVIHGDASNEEILRQAGVERARGLIVSSPRAPANEIVRVAHAVNPELRIFVHTTYMMEAEMLCSTGASAVFSGESEVALAMSEFLMRDLGATDEQIEREHRRIREELFKTQGACVIR